MITVLASISSSLISGAVAIIVCLINNNKQQALTNYKIEELTKHVEKHNNVIERTYELEKKVAVLESEVSNDYYRKCEN